MKRKNFITSLLSFGLVPFIPNVPAKSEYTDFCITQGKFSVGGRIGRHTFDWVAKSIVDFSKPFEVQIFKIDKYGPVAVTIPLEKLQKLVAEKSLDNSSA